MIIPEDKEKTIKLKESEIEEIVRALSQMPHDIFTFFKYDEIITKLNGSNSIPEPENSGSNCPSEPNEQVIEVLDKLAGQIIKSNLTKEGILDLISEFKKEIQGQLKVGK